MNGLYRNYHLMKTLTAKETIKKVMSDIYPTPASRKELKYGKDKASRTPETANRGERAAMVENLNGWKAVI